jgi:broad specificity phosphatase PhoE
MRLLWIRHAESLGNQAQRIQGQIDEPLTQLGRYQASQLGQFLQQFSWRPTHIYTSPLQRAKHTAEILGGAAGYPLIAKPDLQEIHNGVLQGLTWAEARQQYPELCQQLESTPTWLPIPGAETPQQLQTRTTRFVEQLLSQHQQTDQVWIVSHGGILPYLLAALLETPCVWGVKIPLTAVFELELHLSHWPNRYQQGLNPHLWQIHRFNETPHLTTPLSEPNGD